MSRLLVIGLLASLLVAFGCDGAPEQVTAEKPPPPICNALRQQARDGTPEERDALLARYMVSGAYVWPAQCLWAGMMEATARCGSDSTIN